MLPKAANALQHDSVKPEGSFFSNWKSGGATVTSPRSCGIFNRMPPLSSFGTGVTTDPSRIHPKAVLTSPWKNHLVRIFGQPLEMSVGCGWE